MSVATWDVATPVSQPRLSQRLDRIPELDGARGLAIFLVLVCHFGYLFPEKGSKWLNLGWTGVDLFFVLSGFLITRILLASRGEQGYFRTFYARRILRIFPLYFLFVGGYYFVLLPLAHHHGYILNRSAADQVWFWAYLANWNLGSMHSTLTHLWSLGIEEQFYLVWPIVVALVSRKHLGRICLALVAASFLARAILIGGMGLSREASFFTVCRVEGVALGSYLAAGFKLPVPGALATTSLVLLIPALAAGGPNGFGMTVWGITLVAILFASLLQLLIVPGRRHPWMSVALRSRALTSLGTYSYAIYLFHILVLTVAVHLHESRRWPAAPLFGGGVLVSYAVGRLSWHLFECRILRLKRDFESRQATELVARG